MIFPLAVALAAVSLGTALALGPKDGTRSLGVIRWAALVLSLLVVATHLLPEAFEALGYRCLIALALGALLPAAAEKGGGLFARLFGPGGAHAGALVALEIEYAGLCAHRIGDGVSMGAGYAVGTDASTFARAGVVLAVAAHIVPVTTVMILTVLGHRGRRSAIFHGAGLTLATMAGVVTGSMAFGGSESSLGGAHGSALGAWVSAFVAGLLVHIVAHDLPLRSPSSSRGLFGRGSHEHAPASPVSPAASATENARVSSGDAKGE